MNHGIPLNNRRCGICHSSALGFAVFEATTEEGIKTILPIGWRCFRHRVIEMSRQAWEKVGEDFSRRLGKRITGNIFAGISTLTETEVELLIQWAKTGPVAKETRIEVEHVGGKDLVDAFPGVRCLK